MSDPPIIGSGKPHTVSLAEGSTVATQRPTRAGGGRLPEEPHALVREGLAPDPAALAARKTPLRAPPTQAARNVRSRADPPSPAGAIQDYSPLLTRIAQVEQRNGQIRARLAQANGAVNKTGAGSR